MGMVSLSALIHAKPCAQMLSARQTLFFTHKDFLELLTNDAKHSIMLVKNRINQLVLMLCG